MSKFKGTKGPWFMDGSAPFVDHESPKGHQNIGSFVIRTKAKECGENKVIDVCAYEFWGLSIPEARANAILISKAPEMLEMLIEISDRNEGCDEWLERVRNLIKSATEL
jgi:hypothetical protein